VILLLPRGVIPTLSELIVGRRARAAAEPEPTPDPTVPTGMAGVAP
jgi:hypothetical protein